MTENEFKSLLELKEFVDRHGGIRAAARAKGVSHSPISDKLKKLKIELAAREQMQATVESSESPASKADHQKPLHIRQIEEYERQYREMGVDVPEGELAPCPFSQEEWEGFSRIIDDARKKNGW